MHNSIQTQIHLEQKPIYPFFPQQSNRKNHLLLFLWENKRQRVRRKEARRKETERRMEGRRNNKWREIGKREDRKVKGRGKGEKM